MKGGWEGGYGCVNCEGCVRGGNKKSPPSKAGQRSRRIDGRSVSM